MGKLVCEIVLNGEETLVAITTAPNINLGQFVKLRPGVGKPFYYWPVALTLGMVACDFSQAAIVSDNSTLNNQAIAAQTVTPDEVITYEDEV